MIYQSTVGILGFFFVQPSLRMKLRRPVNLIGVFLSGVWRPATVFIWTVLLRTDYFRTLSYNTIRDFDGCIIALMNSKHSFILILELPILVVIEEDQSRFPAARSPASRGRIGIPDRFDCSDVGVPTLPFLRTPTVNVPITATEHSK